MRRNLRVRNLAVNTYFGALVITIVGSIAAIYIVHIGLDAAFPSFNTHAYEIESNL